jgi:hypothetical protein
MAFSSKQSQAKSETRDAAPQSCCRKLIAVGANKLISCDACDAFYGFYDRRSLPSGTPG